VVETPGLEGVVDVQVSADGDNWTTLATYDANVDSGSAEFDITEFISPQTTVRFQTTAPLEMYLDIDNVQIRCDGQPWYYTGDYNRDFRIDFNDMFILAEYWLK
jgi:hypothetical protein